MMRCILTLILVLGTSLAGAGGFLKQSTSSVIKMGPFVDAEDGVTPETGLTISQADIRISKAGSAFAQSNDATGASHDELGYYDVPLDATDTDTVGRLKIVVHKAGALPVWDEYTVLPSAVYDSLIGGSDYLPVDAVQVEGGDATDALAAGAGAALTSYDPPTYAELEARTLQAADYFDPSADGVNVTEVAGSAVASVDDFKADVSSLATVGDFVDAVEDEGTKLHDLWSMTEDDGGVRRFSANALEEAPTGAGSSLTAQDVWEYGTRTITGGTIDTVDDKTGYSLVSDYDAAKTAASQSSVAAVDAKVEAVADDLAHVATEEQVAAATAAAILGASTSDYQDPGTVGEAIGTSAAVVPAEIASAVLGAVLEDYIGAPGTVGAVLAEIAPSAEVGYTLHPYTVSTVTGQPIEGARIEVSTDRDRKNVIRSVLTGADGNPVEPIYLPPGTYYFWTTKAGYAFVNPDEEVVE